jgi:hypothetical protein
VQETADKATSDAQGNYTIAGVAPGTYNVNAVKDGFETTFTEAEVAVGVTTTLNILIAPPLESGKGRIIGRVYDEEGKPMSGVTIRTVPATQTKTTDSDGYYRLVPIDMDFYDVIASKPGFIPDTTIGDLRFTDNADSVNFVLRDSVPKKGLVAYFMLDGNANDAQGTSTGGAMNGAVSVNDRFGISGKALSFNGTNAFVQIPSSTALNLGGKDSSFSISLWIRPNGPQTIGADVLVKGTENTFAQLQQGYRFDIEKGTSSPQLVIAGFKGQNNILYEFPSEAAPYWSDGQWHHVVIVFDRAGKKARRYSDGVSLVGLTLEAGDITQDFGNTAPLILGKNATDDKFFKGDIDDIRIYTRALSANEVSMLYHERGWK